MGGFALVQIDPSLDLFRKLSRIAQRHRHPVGGQREILGKTLRNLLPVANLTRRPTDLPDVGTTSKPCPPPRRPRTKDDPRMSLSPIPLLGIPPQGIREPLPPRLRTSTN